MGWFAAAISSNIGRKWVVSLTGFFLILFLLVHMAGNFTLLKAGSDNGQAFNIYSAFMGHNPLIQSVAWLTKVFILLHILQTLYLTWLSRRARPINYKYEKPGLSSSWSSRNMAFLGTIILIFLVLHLKTFWYEMHYGMVPNVSLDQYSGEDYFLLVKVAFAQSWYVVLYLLALIGLAFHLWHGFESAFQTLGINHVKYTPFIKVTGRILAILIPLGFSTQPIFVYFLSN
jgi:succinate dehydrogenase cytochrome b subunit